MDFDLTEDQRAFQDTARHSRASGSRRTPPLGRGEAFPRRRAARGRAAGLRRHLCGRGAWRGRARARRCRAGVRGAGQRVPVHGRVPDHPQHGRLDDLPVRQRRPARALPAEAHQRRAFRQLLPDRAGLGLGCGGAEDARRAGAATRSIGVNGTKAFISGGGISDLYVDDAAHRRGRAARHFLRCRREGHAGPLLRHAGEEARLEQPADGDGEFRPIAWCRWRTGWARRARASASPCRGSTAAASTSPPARSAARAPAWRRRWPTCRSAARSAGRSPISRRCSSSLRTWRPSWRRRG